MHRPSGTIFASMRPSVEPAFETRNPGPIGVAPDVFGATIGVMVAIVWGTLCCCDSGVLLLLLATFELATETGGSESSESDDDSSVMMTSGRCDMTAGAGSRAGGEVNVLVGDVLAGFC